MRDFSYEIHPGIKEFVTPESRFFVVTRRVPPTHHQTFAIQMMAAPLKLDQPAAWMSLVYNPVRLGREEAWRNIHRQRPQTLAQNIQEKTGGWLDRSVQERLIGLLTQFGLAAASGVIQQPQHDEAIDQVVEAIPGFRGASRSPGSLHIAAQGVLNAHLARVAA